MKRNKSTVSSSSDDEEGAEKMREQQQQPHPCRQNKSSLRFARNERYGSKPTTNTPRARFSDDDEEGDERDSSTPRDASKPPIKRGSIQFITDEDSDDDDETKPEAAAATKPRMRRTRRRKMSLTKKKRPSLGLLLNNKSGKSDGSSDAVSSSSFSGGCSMIRSCKTWNVQIKPYKKYMVGGRLVPTLRQFFPQKQRRLSVEIKRPIINTETKRRRRKRNNSFDSLDSLDSSLDNSAITTSDDNNDEHYDALSLQDIVVLSILRPVRISNQNNYENNGHAAEPHGGDDDDDDGYATDYSKESLPLWDRTATNNNNKTTTTAIADNGRRPKWKLRAEYKLEEVSLLTVTTANGVCELRLGSGNDVVVRDVRFETSNQALEFQQVLRQMESLEKERSKRLASSFKQQQRQQHEHLMSQISSSGLLASLRNVTTTTTTTSRQLAAQQRACQNLSRIHILVEIVSAVGLPGRRTADAYVIVRMGGQEVHRTEYAPKSLDPIWTLEHGSLFLLEMTPDEFFSCAGGMSFTIKNSDALGANTILGQVTVPLLTLLEGKGQRESYPLMNAANSTRKVMEMENKGKLYLRFKFPASPSDIEFMKAYRQNQTKANKAEVYLSETYLPLRHPQTKLLKGQFKQAKDGGETLMRVKPFPDPARAEETKWMTEQQIEAESKKPSTHWVEAGSGNLFKVYFEIIGCDGLPNFDASTLNVYDKTDSFASIAFEDALVNTDVISDSLSPRWMPWCYRAFVFNVSHPSSDILLAIFDYDPESSPTQLISRAAGEDVHDRIGRVRINLAKFLPDTTYNLVYPLFLGGEMDKHRQKDHGRVHVRLRIQCNNGRKAMLTGLVPPQQSYLAVARKVDWEVAHFTVQGAATQDDHFSRPRFLGYVDELSSYQLAIESARTVALAVWLWRGQHKFTLGGMEFMVPVHSMIAFAWGVAVTWNFNLLPSFLFFCVAWVMLASNENMKKHPSRWHQSRGYLSFLRLLLLNSISSETVTANDNIKEIEAYSLESEDVLERWRRRKQYNQEAKKTFRSELRGEIGQMREDIDITTAKKGILKSAGVSVNPLEPVLFRVQKRLRIVVAWLRIGKSIFLWEESYYCFWIVTFSLLACILALCIPWGLVLRWTLRVAAWVLLGPWMKIVDKMWFQDDGSGSDTDEWKKRWKRRYNKMNRKAKRKRIQKERALKLKSMMRYCFGKFLVSIPRFNEEMFRDKPLPESFADPYDEKSEDPIQIAEKKFGQKLSGDMVMQREIQVTSADSALKPKQVRRRRRWKSRQGHLRQFSTSDTEETGYESEQLSLRSVDSWESKK